MLTPQSSTTVISFSSPQAAPTRTALDTAVDYITRGWTPVPVAFRSKKPSAGDGWHLTHVNASNVAQHFNGSEQNVGIQMGPASHNLTDGDMDTEEARVIAPFFMPKTKSKFGRASARWSHYLYYSDLADKPGIGATIVFKDPATKETILELRVGGDGKGAQTVAPGSIHEGSGERIVWEEDGEPTRIAGDDLLRCAKIVAALALLARHWPQRGSKARHFTALRLGGFLARCAWNEVQIELALEAIARAANDEEIYDRRTAGRDARQYFVSGGNTAGFPALRGDFGEAIARRVAEWLNYQSQEQQPETKSDTASKQPSLIKSSREFVAGFVAPDYLVYGLLQEGFLYSLTGSTGAGKTAITLRAAASIALGINFAGRETKTRRVLYLAAENPTDIRMRWIALGQQMDFDVDTIDVFFVEGWFKLSETTERLKQEATTCGGEFGLVVIDTGPVFYEGDDESSRAQQGRHGKMLRSLIDIIPGRPAVLANVHPVKNAGADNLLPAGGGNFLNEVDGNFTAAKTDNTAELHWQGKLRGVDFAPLHFMLRTVTHERLTDSKGRLMPTVICDWISDQAKEDIAKQRVADEDRLLGFIDADPKASLASLAIKMSWLLHSGEPHKTKIVRALKTLKTHKLVKETRTGNFYLTDDGKSALKGEK
jgi:hypothetical protein